MHTFRSIASVLVMGALILSCSDQPTPTESPVVDGPLFSASGSVVHHASLGGADICEATGRPTGCDANFSLVANQYADGSVKGQWHDQFDGAQGIHVAVNCLAIYGNQAVIGGVITRYDPEPAVVGGHAITSVWDNGTSANDPPDQISFSSGPPLTDPFPDCHSVPPGIFAFYGIVWDVVNGQVKVW